MLGTRIKTLGAPLVGSMSFAILQYIHVHFHLKISAEYGL